MNTNDLSRRLARQAKVTQAKAADDLQEAVAEVIVQLREGMAAILPGLGVLMPGENNDVKLEAVECRGAKKRAKK